ncbi:GntR family transcriptional regulator [Granulicella sp. dw_53]|uniref:GntR family transcriptional regulator n=1 Tax=Granulicella sp. dw_53 TaxID=2719792 RepID=UPI0021063C1F|nr:GntR family transcriptional regulator [Granulicella sp. dw_53]
MPKLQSEYAGRMSRRPRQHHGARDLSIREKAYLHIQQLIAQGTLPAGGGISELLLAKELGSSRTPIREAMNQLAAEGLLHQSPGGGMVVAQLTREDIIELYELREALEVYAVAKVSRLTMRPADQDRLQHLVDEILTLQRELDTSGNTHLDQSGMERFIACDLGFHALLMSMAQNSRVQKIINDTRLLISIFAIHRGGHDRAALQSIYEYHQRILDAVVQQHSEAAMTAIVEHIQASQRERLNAYDQWKRETSLRHAVPTFFDIHKMTPQS